MICSLQVLSLPTKQNNASFWNMVMKRKYHTFKEIVRIVNRIRTVRTGQCVSRMCQFSCLISFLKQFALPVFFWVCENFEPLLCMLEDGVVFITDPTMVMFHRDSLLRRVNEIIARAVEAALYKHWISLNIKKDK